MRIVQRRRRRSPSSRGAPTAFPVLKDLVVDRSAFDRIIQAGGFISVNTGSAPEAHAMPVPKKNADRAFDAAACIGCGACVAACPNGVGDAVHRRQGHPPRRAAAGPARAVDAASWPWCDQHDAEGFGGCTNVGECSDACPKEIPLDVIS